MEEAVPSAPAKELAFEPTDFSDLTLRTSDGYTLHVHKLVMSRGCTMWKDTLTTVLSENGAEAVQVEDAWEQLRLLVLFLYPEGPKGGAGKKLATGWAR